MNPPTLTFKVTSATIFILHAVISIHEISMAYVLEIEQLYY